MKFKVGDKVRFVGDYGDHNSCNNNGKSLKEIVAKNKNYFTISHIDQLSGYLNIEEDYYWCFKEDELTLSNKLNGIKLLEEIKQGHIKNCNINVYKNKQLKFIVQCGEKTLLDNPEHHVGMLLSDKYTYEPIEVKEMTIAEIEKELGYPIKVVKED